MTPEYGPGYFTGQSCVTKDWSPEQLWEQTLAATEHIREEFDAWGSSQPPTGRGPSPSPTDALAWSVAAGAAAKATTATRAAGAYDDILPVIDISRYLHGGEVERAAVAKEFDAAFVEVGFCQITGCVSRVRTRARCKPARLLLISRARPVVAQLRVPAARQLDP